ncbi:MAG TPA: hypothetical protein PKD72_04610, partial [Gemmatales bacterium]|nr:hypothetical protein [Gemmatales bacterium]
MADDVTRDPPFLLETEIRQENERRERAIRQYSSWPAASLRVKIRSTLAPSIGPAQVRPAGEILYLLKRWLIHPDDRQQHNNLVFTIGTMSSGGGMG